MAMCVRENFESSYKVGAQQKRQCVTSKLWNLGRIRSMMTLRHVDFVYRDRRQDVVQKMEGK